MDRFPVENNSFGIVINLGDDSNAKTPLSGSRRKHVDRSVSSIDFVDSLQDPPLTLRRALVAVAKDKGSRPALMLVVLMLAFALAELVFSSWANSLCLVAAAFFDLTEAVLLLVSVWGQALARSSKPTLVHSYGFERYETIGRFGAASYFAFVCLWILFEGAERILEVEPTFIHGLYLIQIGVAGIVLQVFHVTVFRRFIKGGNFFFLVFPLFFSCRKQVVNLAGLLVRLWSGLRRGSLWATAWWRRRVC